MGMGRNGNGLHGNGRDWEYEKPFPVISTSKYLRSMAGRTLTDKTFGLHDKDGKFYIFNSEVAI